MKQRNFYCDQYTITRLHTVTFDPYKINLNSIILSALGEKKTLGYMIQIALQLTMTFDTYKNQVNSLCTTHYKWFHD